MAETIRKSQPATALDTENGADRPRSGHAAGGTSLADHLRANPELVWNELGEQIDALIGALIETRLQLEGPFDAADFYDALITRRKARAHKKP